MKKFLFGGLTLVAIVIIVLMLVQCDGFGGIGKNKSKKDVVTLGPGESIAERKCDSKNKGEMVYVIDDAQAYECDEQGWAPVKKNKPAAEEEQAAQGVAKDSTNKEDGRKNKEEKSEKEKREGCYGRVVSSGVEINCDESPVDTVKKESADSAGTECSVRDNGNGTATVKCPSDSAAVNKCGKDVYDPNGSKFCQNDTLQDKCNGKEYDVNTKTCEKGVITEAKKVCGGAVYDANKQFCDFRDNHIYKYVKIGKGGAAQTWMAENLNYSHHPGSQSWCGGTYGTVEGNCDAYGRLYTWAAAMGKSESVCGNGHKCNLKLPVQGICPSGWHMPSRGEWEKLFANVGGIAVAGKMLKSMNGWSNDSRGVDSFLFNALSGGYRTNAGIFFGVGDDADFWTATEDVATHAYNMYVGNKTSEAYIFNYEKNFGFSVRCIRD